MSRTLSSTWLATFKQQLACGIGSVTTDQTRTAIIALQIETLLLKCPTILDEDTAESCTLNSGLTLSSIYNRINCGVMLTEAEATWAQANIYIKEKACQVELSISASEDPKDDFEIFATGIHTWAGGVATTDSIAVVGLISTDIVLTTLVARNATETLILSVNDHTNDQIDLTLSANGANGVTKVSYIVLRANA